MFFKNKGTVLLSLKKQLNVIFDQYIATNTHTHTANSGFSSYDSLGSAIPPTNMEMFTNKKSYIYSLMLNERNYTA